MGSIPGQELRSLKPCGTAKKKKKSARDHGHSYSIIAVASFFESELCGVWSLIWLGLQL